MSAQSATVMRNKNVGTLTPVLATSGMNHFSSKPYSVINLHTRDYTYISPLKEVTGWGQTAVFERDKDHDYFDLDQIVVITAAATSSAGALTTQEYVDGAGYLLVNKPVYKITNSQLNANLVPPYWQKIRHILAMNETFEQYTQCDKLNLLADQNTLFRRAALASGWRFISDFDMGLNHWSKECMQFVVGFNIRPRFQFTLPAVTDVVNNGGAAGTISNATTMISNVYLVQNNLHVNPKERRMEMARLDMRGGIYQLTRKFEEQVDYVPTGVYTHTINLLTNGTHEFVFFVFIPEEYYNPSTDYSKRLLDWGWGTPNSTRTVYTRTIGNYEYRRPETFEIKSSNGNVIFHEQNVYYNQEVYLKRFFPESYGASSVLIANFSEDPHAHNAVMGTYDFNVHGSRQLRLTWPAGSGGSSEDTVGSDSPRWAVVSIFVGPNWIQQTRGSAIATLT